ncbi:MAG: nucleotide exchange factor GrpE [Muribaculaceae bacterium]|jgi:grpE|nr:nucleotide exchange factor GrpE [Muribaculaceae bacterium]
MSNKNKNKHTAPASDADEVEIMDNVQEAETDNQSQSDEEIENSEMSEIDTLAKELGETKEKLEKEKREYLFLMAEFDNFRKRTIKEKGDIIRNAAESVLKGLLPIVDDFERGLAALESTDDTDAAKQGMQLIYNKLIKYLEQNGVKPIESTGAEFNPDLHEAIAMVPTEDEKMKGKVIDTPTKGYTINDKVLRYAKVAVGQ